MSEIRAYRRAVDRGEISSVDGARRVEMAGREGEMLLTLVELQYRGLDGPIDVAPHAEEQYQAPRLLPHRTKRVAVKRGVDRHGNLIDDKTVMIESNHAGDDPETAAEIEALT